LIFIVFMAREEGLSVPGPFGGLVRYDAEYESRFILTPMQVFIFIGLIVLFVIGLKIFWPVAA